ncbi:MAG: ATP-binding protein [Desulfuromonadaceae bacterium]|nr:ATP-binding protein [Desulfuromonadaceae bacterium]
MNARITVSIKTQFVLLAMLLVAISSALWGWWSWKNERHLLFESLEGEGRQMVTTLASPIINALLYEEMGVIEEGGLLDNFIEEIMNNTGFPVVYAYVTDRSGKVLAHNNYSEYGKNYTDSLTAAALAEGRYASVLAPATASHSSLLDMAMPLRIYGKSWGALRVGISTVPLEQELAAMARRIMLVSLAFFLFGVLLSWLIGRGMARPLQRLTALMAAVSTDNLDIELPPRRPDEIGVLQDSFLAMLERLRRSEGERERAVAQLIQSEKMASIGKIVAGVAHEVNNPLATIATCIYNIEQSKAAPNRSLEILKQGAERIERIVRQLTDFSRAGALEIQPFGSSCFFDEFKEFGRMALKNRRIRFVAEDQCIPPIAMNLDKGKIHQVVLNLLVNAADASPENGEVRLTTAVVDDRYLISVHDQGNGIPDGQCEQIFDIFYTTKPAGEGTGIGLAICKSIVEMHGGTLCFESRPGDTTFTVSIPVSPQRGDS